MIYDRLAVTLLTALAAEDRDSTSAVLARYVVEHAAEMDDLSVRALATACNVGTGSVSRFVRDVGFSSFDDLRAALVASQREFALLSDAPTATKRALEQAAAVQAAVEQVARSVDRQALARLVADIAAYEHVSIYGPLKA